MLGKAKSAVSDEYLESLSELADFVSAIDVGAPGAIGKLNAAADRLRLLDGQGPLKLPRRVLGALPPGQKAAGGAE